MHLDWSTFALQTINFVILVWLLQRFLYRPVLRLIDARRAEIDRQYSEAHALEAKAKEQLAVAEAGRAAIAADRAAALREAAGEAEAAAVERRVRAERDAAALVDAARKTLAVEREHALDEVRRAALDFGTDIAARLLVDLPAKLRAEAWIERIDNYLAALSAPERDALVRQLPDDVPLKVTTAAALSAETAQAWRALLRRTLGNVTVDFTVEPALVAGAELHFPNTALRFSWQSALATLRAQIEADGHAR